MMARIGGCTLQHGLGVALEGGREPWIVRIQEDLRRLPVPEQVGPVRMIPHTGVPPLSPEP